MSFQAPAAKRGSSTARMAHAIVPIVTALLLSRAMAEPQPSIELESRAPLAAEGVPVWLDRAMLQFPVEVNRVEFSLSGRERNPGAALAGELLAPQPGLRGNCPGPILAFYDNLGDLMGPGPFTFNIQAGFVEEEIAAVSFAVAAAEYPITINNIQALLAQQNATVQTTTQYSIMVWDGRPDLLAPSHVFSSDNVILPHVVMQPGTQATLIFFSIDPMDPEQIVLTNAAGHNLFTVGLRIDQHNNPPVAACNFGLTPAECCPPPTNSNAFPTTDTNGANQQNNWLRAHDNCGQFACTGGWFRFANLQAGCRPTGDWVIRSEYTCTPPTLIGACCRPDGTCLDGVESSQCGLLGGTFQGDQSLCSGVTCPPPTGACCNRVTGGCLDGVEEATCAGLPNAVYAGHGTLCSQQVCALGACCMPDGSCDDLVRVDCEAMGGTYHGAGTECISTLCPQPTGACCIGTSCIANQTETGCDSFQGSWLGAGTTCAPPNPCITCSAPSLVWAHSVAVHKTGPGATAEFFINFDLGNSPASDTSESRNAGIRILEFQFDQSVVSASIAITGPGGSNAGGGSLTLMAGTNGPTSLGRIVLPGSLANDAVYSIAISASSGVSCNLNRTICVSALAGDFNSDGAVTAADKASMLGFVFQSITQSNALYDLQTNGGDSGTIEVTDVGSWAGFFGTTVSGDPCP